MTSTEPVRDWASDYDIFDPAYVKDPYPIWDDLRGKCPVAHTDRWGGSWLPTTYDDVCAFARDVEHFSSWDPIVAPRASYAADAPDADVKAPPITSDPPEHTGARRLILPAFAPRAVEHYESVTRELCRSLVDRFADDGRCDGAADYAQQIPVRVIAKMLGVPTDMADEFTSWVRGVLELGLQDPEVRFQSRMKIINFFREQVALRRAEPRDDLITYLLNQEIDGQPVPESHVLGTCNLLLVAGIDTTWSAIGASLWHLATHDDDRRRLVADPSLIPSAVEEFLRAYAPVTMARRVTEDVEFHGHQLHEGDRILMAFPAANRDPEHFPDADKVVIDREHNRHIAFGVGIHRCAGSNLARMEMRIALEEWLARIPEFHLEDPEKVTWAGGQVRGPRQMPIVFA